MSAFSSDKEPLENICFTFISYLHNIFVGEIFLISLKFMLELVFLLFNKKQLVNNANM